MELNLKQKKILKLLSINCRYSNKDIAKAVKISEDAVAYQIDKLLNQEKLANYVTQFFTPALGYQSHHVWIRTNNPVKAILKLKEVHSANKCYGKFDYQILIHSITNSDFNEALRQIKSKIKVLDIKTATVADAYKHFTNVIPPINIELKLPDNRKKIEHKLNTLHYSPGDINKTFELKKKDKQIIEVLIRKPRASYHEISEETKINRETVRYRIKKLIQNKLIMNFGLIHNFHKYNLHTSSILLNVKDYKLDSFKKTIHSIPNVFYTAKAKGDYNIILYITSKDPTELGKITERIRESLKEIIESDLLLVGEILKYEQFPRELLK